MMPAGRFALNYLRKRYQKNLWGHWWLNRKMKLFQLTGSSQFHRVVDLYKMPLLMSHHKAEGITQL